MQRTLIILLITYFIITGYYVSYSHAEDARVLPQGRFMMRIRGLYTCYDERFNPHGNKEPIGVDFDRVNVNRNVFPALGSLETLLGLPSNSLTLGNTRFTSKVEEFDYPLYIAYGLRKNVSLGIVIPILNIRRKVDFSISGGNVGFVPGKNTLLPVGTGGVTKPVDTEDVQKILESPVFGFELKRLKGFNRTGIGDIRFGFKHQYYSYNRLRLAYSLSLRLPTGEANDPDDLLDIPFGDGQPDLVFELHNDLLPSDDSILNLYIRYTLQLPDHEVMRIQTSANEPIAPKKNKENMKRNLGDYFESEILFSHKITDSTTIGFGYNFLYKWRDRIKSPDNRDTKSLEDETDKKSHSIRLNIGYSTFPAFLRGRFSLPMEIILEGSKVLNGKNIPLTSTIGLDLRFFF